MDDLAAYNYTYFDQYIAEGGHERDEAAFRTCFHVGDEAQSFTLPRLDDGVEVRLSDLWKSKPLVLEFGSFTCPYPSFLEGPLLDAAAGRHPEVNWAFIYTREAHPGEVVLPHDSFDAKQANARLLRDQTGISRPILVDDLAGTVHRRYGTMPNMTWVIDGGGRIAYRANWTSAANVEAFLDRYLTGQADRSRGSATLYETEQLEFRQVDRDAFNRRLLRYGPRAVTEFGHAMKLWAQED